jgi:hypothetical protein
MAANASSNQDPKAHLEAANDLKAKFGIAW